MSPDVCFFYLEWGLSVCRQEEDEQDRFERMQETTLPACPASVSFYKAKMKTDQKVISPGPNSTDPCRCALGERFCASLPGGV